jgi:hypothetical protein
MRASAKALIAPLEAERDALARWKAEALPVIAGLQELGRALDLPLGVTITGPMALQAVARLKCKLAAIETVMHDTAGPALYAAIREALDAEEGR